MEKGQKRLIAIVLCIIGIVGTLMAARDFSALDETGRAQESETDAVSLPQE